MMRWWVKWLRGFTERHRCDSTTVEVDAVKQEGFRPQVRVRLICKHHELLLGEALYNPGRADDLAREISRLARNVHTWVGES
jgi:hypothetical protein